jgi:hydroxymethylglutaryl-CoA lyase
VRELLRALRDDLGSIPITAHFHDTRGLGLANVLAALDAGVRAFDASLGGLGGCPYAPGASGNICTEDLVFMLESMGLKTGIDLDRLLEVREYVQRALQGQPFHGAIARAGLPKGFNAARAV